MGKIQDKDSLFILDKTGTIQVKKVRGKTRAIWSTRKHIFFRTHILISSNLTPKPGMGQVKEPFTLITTVKSKVAHLADMSQI